MSRILVIACLSILIVGWLPNSSQAASTNQPLLTNLGGASIDAGVVYTDQQLVDITAAKQQQLNSAELAKLKRELSKEGWKAAGKAFLSGGKWLLKFTRTVVNGIIVLPGMYVDKANGCVRYRANGKAVPGSTCGAQV